MKNNCIERLASIAQKYKNIHLLILFGSRSQGLARDDSDWDFGFIGENFDSMPLFTDLQLLLETNHLDLVDLTRASALLRFRAAKDGTLIFESPHGQYEKFWLEAVNFWCESSSLFQVEYEAILKELG